MRNGLMSIAAILLLSACGVQTAKKVEKFNFTTNPNGKGAEMLFEFSAGKAHNHPSMAIWMETVDGTYIQTLYVTNYFAKGVFGNAPLSDTTWSNKPGPARRPAGLPYWAHQRGIKVPDGTYNPTPENPIPDAYSGATPKGDFSLNSKSDAAAPEKFRILMEINQPWDWNTYWHNNKFPGDNDYKTSAQPSVVYAVMVSLTDENKEYYLNPIGHGHYSGKDGKLYTNLKFHTDALNIVDWAKVTLK